jgi:hypothetical protein
VLATRGVDLDNVFPKCCQGVLPIPRESLAATLQVSRIKGNLRGRRITPTNMLAVVCEICNRPTTTQAVSGDRRSSMLDRVLQILGSSSPATPASGIGPFYKEIELLEAL